MLCEVRSRLIRQALLAATLLSSVAAGTTVFERRWHWFDADVGRSVALAADGGYVVGAGTSLGGSAYGALLVWVDSLGETTAVRTVSQLDNGSGYLCRVADGGYVIAGTYDTLHVFARKFSAAGDSVWTYKSATRGVVQAVVGAPDGGCLVLGQIPDTMYHMGAIKLDSAGNEQWNRYYSDPGVYATMAQGGAPTRDGGYILCGNGHDYMDTYIRFVLVDSTGKQVWSHLYLGAVDASLYDASETPDRGFLAVGSEWDTLQSHYALYIARTDSSGGLLWTRSFSPAGAGTQANAMEVTSDTGYALAGTIDWGDSARAWLVRIDPGADTLWTHALPGKGIEQGADVRQTADGGFVVAGTSDSAGGSVLLVKTDSLGGTAISVTEPSSPAREHAVFSVMPNPTSGFVRFESSSANADAELRLFDVTGRLVRLWIGQRNRVLQLDTRTLSAGVYLLRLSSGRSSATRELVVE
jgi:hypothetical protein